MANCQSCGILVPTICICTDCKTNTGPLHSFDIMLQRFENWAIRMEGAFGEWGFTPAEPKATPALGANTAGNPPCAAFC